MLPSLFFFLWTNSAINAVGVSLPGPSARCGSSRTRHPPRHSIALYKKGNKGTGPKGAMAYRDLSPEARYSLRRLHPSNDACVLRGNERFPLRGNRSRTTSSLSLRPLAFGNHARSYVEHPAQNTRIIPSHVQLFTDWCFSRDVYQINPRPVPVLIGDLSPKVRCALRRLPPSNDACALRGNERFPQRGNRSRTTSSLSLGLWPSGTVPARMLNVPLRTPASSSNASNRQNISGN